METKKKSITKRLAIIGVFWVLAFFAYPLLFLDLIPGLRENQFLYVLLGCTVLPASIIIAFICANKISKNRFNQLIQISCVLCAVWYGLPIINIIRILLISFNNGLVLLSCLPNIAATIAAIFCAIKAGKNN